MRSAKRHPGNCCGKKKKKWKGSEPGPAKPDEGGRLRCVAPRSTFIFLYFLFLYFLFLLLGPPTYITGRSVKTLSEEEVMGCFSDLIEYHEGQ